MVLSKISATNDFIELHWEKTENSDVAAGSIGSLSKMALFVVPTSTCPVGTKGSNIRIKSTAANELQRIVFIVLSSMGRYSYSLRLALLQFQRT